jgi:chitin synthase
MSIWIFAFLTVYMVIAAILCAVHAINNLNNVMFVRLIVSILSTYGVYVIASIMACDPFHLITCFVQYLLLQASEWGVGRRRCSDSQCAEGDLSVW